MGGLGRNGVEGFDVKEAAEHVVFGLAAREVELFPVGGGDGEMGAAFGK